MRLEQIKKEIPLLSIQEKKELIQFIKSSLPRVSSFSIRRSIANTKSSADLPNLKIIAYRKEVLRQEKKYGGNVGFEDALTKAIQNYLTDGAKSDSPYWLVEQVPDDYGFNYDTVSSEKIKKVLHSFLNDGHSTLELITPESRFPPEYGEKIEENWLFLLKVNRFSASLHWAIVPRNGDAVFNYGYG